MSKSGSEPDSRMNPIHPDLAPLASVAKSFSRTFRTTGKVNQPELAAALHRAWFVDIA